MLRLIIFLTGFGLAIIGFIYVIMYLNYLTIGYSFIDYLFFIMKRIECMLTLIGLFLVGISIFMKGDKYVLCL